jgi:hypothetical protein
VSEQGADQTARLLEAYAAFNRGDYDRALEGTVHPEVEFFPPGGQPPIRGADRFRAWMEPDAFESQTLEPLDFRAAENGVLVRLRMIARGAGSGLEMDMELWNLWTFDDAGLITRVQVFLPHEGAEARAAAGLAEPP